MAGPLVAGYDSDSGSGSDDEGSTSVQPITTPVPQTATASQIKLPSPSTSKPGSGLSLPPPTAGRPGSGLALPPPRNSTSEQAARSTSKRKADAGKFQIRVESLSDLGPGDEDEEQQQPEKKRPKPIAAAGSSHALFGMLPAPKRAEEVAREKREEEEKKARAGALQIAADLTEAPLDSDADAEDGKPKKGKGNADFRAMLGLKPTAAPKRVANASAAPKIEPPPAAVQPLKFDASTPSLTASDVEPAAPSSSSAPSTSKPAAPVTAPTDFFSLHSESSGAPVPAASASSTSRLSSTISAAPRIDSDEAANNGTQAASSSDDQTAGAYRGWQQNPDGSWVPVTPEAQASYAAWQASQAAEASLAQAYDDPGRRRANQGGFDVGELARAGIREEDLATVDAASLASWNGPTAPSGGSTLDARYASAAAESAAGVPAGANKMDKMKGQKARQKGQLTSLLAHADEKRAQLEERWARGKAKGQASAAKYGFR